MLSQTPPHAGFRELISGLYDSQRLLAAAAFTFELFRDFKFLCTLLNDYRWLEWKRNLGCGPRSFRLCGILRQDGRGNRYG